MKQKINFGLKINELLEARKISKTAAAKMMGYSRKGFSDAVDKEDVNTSILKKICEVFDIDMDYFLSSDAKNIHQSGNANIVGSGNTQNYKSRPMTRRDEEIYPNDESRKYTELIAEIEHLTEENQFLKKVVEFLTAKKDI